MPRIYLRPTADLTFKRIFGEHKNLVISLINALLPLEGDEEVREVEYLPAELVPELPTGKNSIVDVRCKDGRGRQFIVEMQTIWSPAFMQRVLFNASKVYVNQIEKSTDFKMSQPVYSLNILNDTYMEGDEYANEYIHNYSIVHERHTDKIIEGLHFTFIELPKFHPSTTTEKKMTVLWLKFLTTINEDTLEPDADLMENPDTKQALTLVREASFSPAQVRTYEKFWDEMWRENLLISDSLTKGIAQGIAKGRAQGREEGMEEGRILGREEGISEGIAIVAQKMISRGDSDKDIADVTGLTAEQVKTIRERGGKM